MSSNSMVSENRIKEIKSRGDKSCASLPSAKLAIAVERHLYSTSRSIQAYADKKTLNSRLRLVLVTLSRRRMSRAQRSQRHAVLRKKMGEKLYKEVIDTIAQIQTLRLTRIARDCPSCQGGSCTLRSTGNVQVRVIEAQTRPPSPVRRLFFETRLCPAFETAETTPVDQPRDLDWTTLVQQAKKSLHDYKQWESVKETESTLCLDDDVDASKVAAV